LRERQAHKPRKKATNKAIQNARHFPHKLSPFPRQKHDNQSKLQRNHESPGGSHQCDLRGLLFGLLDLGVKPWEQVSQDIRDDLRRIHFCLFIAFVENVRVVSYQVMAAFFRDATDARNILVIGGKFSPAIHAS
jgi:hypothetical protein